MSFRVFAEALIEKTLPIGNTGKVVLIHTQPLKHQQRQAAQSSSEEFESTAFLSGADKNKYGQTFDDLENNQMKIVDSFPKTVINTYNFISRWKDNMHRHSHTDLSNDGVNFTTRCDKN
jgi:hypothetical protein